MEYEYRSVFLLLLTLPGSWKKNRTICHLLNLPFRWIEYILQNSLNRSTNSRQFIIITITSSKVQHKARILLIIERGYEKFLTSCSVSSSKLNALFELVTDVSLNWFPQYPWETMQIRLKSNHSTNLNELWSLNKYMKYLNILLDLITSFWSEAYSVSLVFYETSTRTTRCAIPIKRSESMPRTSVEVL